MVQGIIFLVDEIIFQNCEACHHVCGFIVGISNSSNTTLTLDWIGNRLIWLAIASHTHLVILKF